MSEVKFGTGGFRGIIGDNYTRENLERIAQAVANIATRENLIKKICIGYDNRFMAETFALWVSRVFAANGFKVELLEKACATPVVMYRTLTAKYDFGIMITASHNPYMYNGIKIFTKDGRDASVEDTKKIEQEYNSLTEIKASENNDGIEYVDYVEEFVDYLVRNQEIGDCSNLSVVFDSKHGSTKEEIDYLCKKANINNYEVLNGNRDPFFEFETPAPSKDNVELLKSRVLERKANIGFVLDADGDRLGVIDELGNYIDNNVILPLVYYYLVKYEGKKGDIVKNLATSSLIDCVASNLGYKCHEVPVGFKYISSGLIETGSVVGGESSGGLALQNHIWGKDSLVAIALCLKIISRLNKPFSEIVKELYEFAKFEDHIEDKQYHYSLSEEKRIKDSLFTDKKLPIFTHKVDHISYADGVKIYFANGDWSLVRFSGTEPLVRIFNEFKDKKDAKEDFSTWEKFLNLKNE